MALEPMKYVVKNWRQFQHYKDRNPPWIKLHFSILSSKDWVVLDDASRVLAIACMLVASRSEGEIDGSEAGLDYLQRVAYLKRKPSLKSLIDCGFLEPASGCKQMLADARPETETEVLTETNSNGGKINGHTKPDITPIVLTLPLSDGSEFDVRESLVKELEPLYPAVDVQQTLREMKGWLVGNPSRRKTRSGARKFIVGWLHREQEKHGG